MFKNKKVLVYPYDSEFSPILRNKDMFSGYDVIGLVSPGGWGMSGKDAGIADDGDKLNLIVSNDFDDMLPLCDSVFFSEAVLPLDFDRYILPKVIKGAEQGKEILFFRKMEKKHRATLEEVCVKNNVGFMSYDNYGDVNFAQNEFDVLHKINTPIIFVAGVYERTQKFEIQLSLRERLSSMGYKVSQVGSRGYCELLGFHSFPKFMYSSSVGEEKKIFQFNNYIKSIETNENPDVIIIGIPGGVMRLNDTFTSRFGILAYEVSQAVTPDAAILSTLYEDFNPEYFQKLTTSIKYKLGIDISCYNLSNLQFDWSESKDNNKEYYLSLESSFIDQKKVNYDKLETPIFNILNKEDKSKIANYLIDILSYFGEIESV